MTTDGRPPAPRPRRAGPRGVLLLVALLAGCGGQAGVSGTVTYDGAPVESGFITFFPEGDAGPTRGAEIVAGKYRVAGLAPGRKRVLIVSRPVARKARAPGGLAVRVSRPADAVPAAAVGNNQVLAVAGGEQTLDFHLRRPKR